ncbi:MAG: asparagine synthase-related protein, partial [Candidatus Thorarchaeota archaeon]
FPLAKATLRYSGNPITGFQQQMEKLFALFRGDTRRIIDSESVQGFIQLDSRVNDGFLHETEDGFLIELGMNFSEVPNEKKIRTLVGRHKEDICKILDGPAVLIFIQKDFEKTLIVTDPFGLFPLYSFKDENSFVISTDLMGILQTNPERRKNLNRQSIVEFVACHFIMENRTLFTDINRMQEGSLYVYDNATKSLTFEEWIDIPNNHIEEEVDYWITEVSKKFNAALKKRITVRSGAFLSGGMDSRVILAAIPEKYRRQMKALTFGVEGADDTRIAMKVAKRFGIDLRHMVLDTDIFRENFLKHIWMSAGISNHMVAPIAPAVSMLNVERIFDGFAGDAQFGGGFHNQTLDLELGQWPIEPSSYLLEKVIEKGYIRPLHEVADVIKDMKVDDFLPYLRQGIEGELSRFDQAHAPTVIFEMILFRMRVRGNTLGAHISADSICPVMKPYYDLDFANTIMQIPPRMRRKHRFYNLFVKRVLPAALRDPTTTILPYERWSRSVRFVKRVLRFLARKLGIILFPKRGWIPIDKWIRSNPEYRQWIQDILQGDRTKNRGLFDQAGIKRLLHQEIVEKKNIAMTFVNAVDLELILRLYSDGDGFELFVP